MNPIPLIRASSAMSLVAFLGEIGAPAEKLWESVGLSLRAVAEPERLIPLELTTRFFETAARSQDIPDLGVRVASRSRLDSVGRFGVVIRSAPTLHAALETAREAVRLHNSGARYWTVEEGATVRLCRRFRSGDTDFRQSDLFTVGLMIDVVRAVAGPDWRPSRVELQSTGEIDTRRCELLADAVVATGRPVTSITFPRAFLARSLAAPARPPAPASSSWQGSGPPGDFLASLDLVISTLIESEHADVATAARAAGLSVRSFQRRLTELGASFSDLVDQARFRRASELLLDSDVKIIEVAFALGYSDPAHFTRAFRRWTSLSPLEYRHLHLQGGAGSTRRSA